MSYPPAGCPGSTFHLAPAGLDALKGSSVSMTTMRQPASSLAAKLRCWQCSAQNLILMGSAVATRFSLPWTAGICRDELGKNRLVHRKLR